MKNSKSKFRRVLRNFFIASDEERDGTMSDRVSGLRRYVSQAKRHFVKGGRFAWLESTFEAFESFLFVPDKTTPRQGCQIRDAVDLKRTMITVVIALMPALLFGIWNIGYQHYLALGEKVSFWFTIGYGLAKALPVIVVTYVTGLAIEFTFAQIRHHQVNEGFLVTGLLIPMVLPHTLLRQDARIGRIRPRFLLCNPWSQYSFNPVLSHLQGSQKVKTFHHGQKSSGNQF